MEVKPFLKDHVEKEPIPYASMNEILDELKTVITPEEKDNALLYCQIGGKVLYRKLPLLSALQMPLDGVTTSYEAYEQFTSTRLGASWDRSRIITTESDEEMYLRILNKSKAQLQQTNPDLIKILETPVMLEVDLKGLGTVDFPDEIKPGQQVLIRDRTHYNLVPALSPHNLTQRCKDMLKTTFNFDVERIGTPFASR